MINSVLFIYYQRLLRNRFTGSFAAIHHLGT